MWTGFEVCIVIGRCIGAICEMRGLASILKPTLLHTTAYYYSWVCTEGVGI